MTKQLKKVICFFAPNEMREQLHQVASDREVPLSQLLRTLVKEFLMSQGNRKSNDRGLSGE